MILIKKGPEPHQLRNYRCQSGACYADMPKDVKDLLLEALRVEQHGLCAYCTCRIPEESAKDRGQKPMTIEHVYPQHPLNEEPKEGWDLLYSNMHAVCSGNRGCGSGKALTCDAAKGDSIIRLNPCDEAIIAQIHYRADGTIYSDNVELNAELTNVLNLNCHERSLPQNRRAVLIAIQKKLSGNTHFRKACKQYLDNLIENPTPFCGYAIEWLKKKLAK